MRRGKRRPGRLCLALWLLLFSALLLGCSCASAAERMYGITEAELAILEENLSGLSDENEWQRERLRALQERLDASETGLRDSERRSRMLGARLDWLSKELAGQASLLENANRLLEEYEQEARRKQRRVERQRNIAYALAAVAVILCAAK